MEAKLNQLIDYRIGKNGLQPHVNRKPYKDDYSLRMGLDGRGRSYNPAELLWAPSSSKSSEGETSSHVDSPETTTHAQTWSSKIPSGKLTVRYWK